MKNIFLNSISKFSIIAALCVTLLSACGGSSTESLPADQLAYNAALANYNAAGASANPVAAYNAAIDVFNTFKINYPTSTRVDDADYYIARATHELALIGLAPPFQNMPTLQQARDIYVTLINTASNRADDAQYQIGRTYYDVPVPTALDYSTALGHFQAVLSTYGTTASAADDAQFYIGRTIHEGVLLPVLPLPTATYTLENARTEYLKVNATTYPGSIRLDDARYQVGRTYYDVAVPTALDYSTALGHFQAVLSTYGITASAAVDAQFYIGRTIHQGTVLGFPSTPTVTYTYLNARSEYGVFVSTPTVPTPYPLSIRLDDAAFYSALTFHDENNDCGEKAAMTAFVNSYSAPVSSIFIPDAQGHLLDIALGTGGHGICP